MKGPLCIKFSKHFHLGISQTSHQHSSFPNVSYFWPFSCLWTFHKEVIFVQTTREMDLGFRQRTDGIRSREGVTKKMKKFHIIIIKINIVYIMTPSPKLPAASRLCSIRYREKMDLFGARNSLMKQYSDTTLTKVTFHFWHSYEQEEFGNAKQFIRSLSRLNNWYVYPLG